MIRLVLRWLVDSDAVDVFAILDATAFVAAADLVGVVEEEASGDSDENGNDDDEEELDDVVIAADDVVDVVAPSVKI